MFVSFSPACHPPRLIPVHQSTTSPVRNSTATFQRSPSHHHHLLRFSPFLPFLLNPCTLMSLIYLFLSFFSPLQIPPLLCKCLLLPFQTWNILIFLDLAAHVRSIWQQLWGKWMEKKYWLNLLLHVHIIYYIFCLLYLYFHSLCCFLHFRPTLSIWLFTFHYYRCLPVFLSLLPFA